jgi:hypothetical protein
VPIRDTDRDSGVVPGTDQLADISGNRTFDNTQQALRFSVDWPDWHVGPRL